MNDETYLFISDVRDKKRTARGYHNKVRQGGTIKMPYDYLSRREKMALNGEVNTYSLSKPMGFSEFSRMPGDIQREYLCKLSEFGTSEDIKNMLGISKSAWHELLRDFGIEFRRGPATKEEKARWAAFIEEEDTETISADTANIATLLAALVGTGAKLTIEVTL